MINIVMLTYNQENYISAAIESVLMQKNAPPYKIIIGDDCSTDLTSNICSAYQIKYPDIITVLRSENNCGIIENYLKCFKYCDYDYIAILEGDDYWMDPNKLAMQYSIFCSNNRVGLIHTNYCLLNQSTNKLFSIPGKVLENTRNFQGDVVNKLLERNFICAPTVMFRKCILANFNFEEIKKMKIKTIDLLLWLECSRIFEFCYLDNTTTVYRVIENSVSHNRNFYKMESWINSQILIKDYFINKYDIKFNGFEDFKGKLYFKLALHALNSIKFKVFYQYFKLTRFKHIILFLKDWKTYH